MHTLAAIHEEVVESLEQAELALDALRAVRAFEGADEYGGVEEWLRQCRALLDAVKSGQTGQSVNAPLYSLVGISRELTRCIMEHRSVYLRVYRVSGETETVRFEPYAIAGDPGRGKTLVCYHIEHDHWERIPLDRIRAMVGWGADFTPRERKWDR